MADEKNAEAANALASAGIRHAMNSNLNDSNTSAGSASSHVNTTSTNSTADAPSSSFGRLSSAIASRGSQLSQHLPYSPFAKGSTTSPTASSTGVTSSPTSTGGRTLPPPPPRPRPSSTSESSSDALATASRASVSPSPSAPKRGGGASGLVSSKKFGDVDVSSAKSAFATIRHGTDNKTKAPPPVAPPLPSAVSNTRSSRSFAPPPSRATPAPRREPTPPPAPEEAESTEDEAEGEWAEALYDYQGDEGTDISLHQGEKIWVVERSSDEWWTGEREGKRGLFPASYVKVL
ncbi:SH3-domain-containing protein [Sistotremastrum suecicum HHB10207 ss-3]|uniref:SH3-domain-containing protein n=1 Tax=Sistotremastrum suecicum HHB10207 ss-3 TaxID=1314776 RepID=A0A166DVL6_9AGAM|nr:SH3-domain-containing protein [Sistotremastrum suecicum HHB10207 ss-3]